MTNSNNGPIVAFVSGLIMIFFISFLLNFFGFISLDKFWFWKNSEKKAASEISFILKTPVEKINQSDLFLALNPSQKSPKAIDARTKFKNFVLEKNVELNLRVVSIEKFGNRYVVVSKDEKPKNNAEMLGADAARGLLGAIGKQTDVDHVVSICGNATIFATNKDQMKVLDQLDKGSIIKVRGTVESFSVGGSKGILNGLGSIGNFFSSDKDDIASCLIIDKAILISSGGGEKSWLGVFKEEFNGASTSNSPENYLIDPKQVTFIQKPEGQEVDPEVAQSVCKKAADVIQLKSVTFKGKEASLGENITVLSSSDKRIEFSLSGNENKQKSEFIILNKTKDKLELVLSDRDVNCLYTFNRAM